MKQLTCEMCGSTDLIKKDGVFECQSCGCKYSVEEAKKMMIEGTVDVSGSTVKVDNSGMIENYLNMATNAVDSGNNQEAESYANKVIELDATNSIAWMVKGAAAGWQTTGANNRYNEAIDCWINATNYMNEENAIRVLDYVSGSVSDIGNAIVQMHCNNFVNYRCKDNVNDIISNASMIINGQTKLASSIMFGEFSLDIIKKKADIISNSDCEESSNTNEYRERIIAINEKILNFGNMIAKTPQSFTLMINKAAVDAFAASNADFGPDNSDRTDYAYTCWLAEVGFCLDIEDFAMKCASEINSIEQIYENIKFIHEAMINSCSYEYSAGAYFSGYIKSKSLTDSAIATHRRLIIEKKNNRDSLIQVIKEREEKEKREKVEEYWNEHPEEKEALEKEKEELKVKIKEIESASREAIVTISAEKENVLGSEEIKNFQSAIKSLEAERDSLGFFKGKEKAALQEKINELEKKIQSIKKRMDAEYQAIQERLDEETAKMHKQTTSYKSRLKTIEYDLNNRTSDTRK